MFDVNNIKIGDYVETKKGEIGYVTEAKPNGNTCFKWFWKKIDGTDMYTGARCPLNKIFKQIGVYKFDDEEVKKIEKLQLEPKFETRKCVKVTFENGRKIEARDINEEICTGIEEIPNYTLYVKINEIIDRLNKIE